MTLEEHKQRIGIPESHSLVQTATKWRASKGLDIDYYWYDELDENGNIVTKYLVEDGIEIYPPQKKYFHYEEIS